MTKIRIILAGIFIIALLVAGISFAALKAISASTARVETLDKAKLLYDRAEDLLDAGEMTRAMSAFTLVAGEYSDSEYAERSLREMASIYLRAEEYRKAIYCYDRLLRDFPGAKDAGAVRSTIKELNLKIMQTPAMTENSVEYEVQPGDTLYGIAKKFNTTVGLLKRVNALEGDMIRAGQKLKVVTSQFSIFIDKSRNILVLNKDGEPFKTYAVSTGKDNSTPVGEFKIEEKMVKPVWYKVGAVVSSDSKEYELGERWMGISAEGYGIHGTADESTIGFQVTQGCIRMKNADVIELYDIVPSGTEVVIVDSASEEKPVVKNQTVDRGL